MNETEQPQILRPTDIFYEQPITNPTDQTIAAQKNVTFLVERIEATPDGILKYYQDLLYPDKGWPTPEAMWNCNIVKRKLMGLLYIFSHKAGLLPIFGFLLTPWRFKVRWLNNFLQWFTWESEWVLHTSYFKEEIWGPCPKELKKAMYLFLNNLGLDYELSKRFAKELAFLIETDNAYRYRIEDIFSECDYASLLASPRREIGRLLALYIEREQNGIEFKFKLITKLISFGLLIPKIKKAFINMVRNIDITKLQLDEADEYHVLMRDGYKFLGLTFEERWDMWVKLHNGKPPQPIIYGVK